MVCFLNRAFSLYLPAALFVASSYAFAHLDGHASDELKSAAQSSLLSVAQARPGLLSGSAVAVGFDDGSQFLLWETGAALSVNTAELAAAGLKTKKKPFAQASYLDGGRTLFVAVGEIPESLRLQAGHEALFAHFLMNQPHLISYSALSRLFSIQLPRAQARWSCLPKEGFAALDPVRRWGPSVRQPDFSIVLEAAPLVRRGLNLKKLQGWRVIEGLNAKGKKALLLEKALFLELS